MNRLKLTFWYAFIFCLLAGHDCFSQKNEELVIHKIDEQNGLSDNNVKCVYKDKNDFVWIGTASGLNLMNGSGITIFKHEPGNNNSLRDNNITALTGDSTGLIWIGTSQGLNSFELSSQKFHYYPGIDNNEEISCVLADTFNVYIGTLDGLFFLNRKTNKIQTIKIPGDNNESLADNRITHLSKDPSGKIWITTFNGLWSYNKNKNQFIHEINKENGPDFKGLFLYSMVGHNGEIWIGTWDQGLKKYDPKTKKITSYSLKSNEEINSIAEIKQPGGNYILWLNGNSRAFDPDKNKEIFLQETLSYPKIPTIQNLYVSQDNWLWMGTLQGLYFYNPAKSLILHRRFSKPITTQEVSLLEWNNKILVSGSGKNFLKAYNNDFTETDDFSKDIKNYSISCLALRFSGENTLKAGTSKGIADINLLTHKVRFHYLDSLTKKYSSGNFITSLFKGNDNLWWVFPWRNGIWQTDSSYKDFHQVFYNFLTRNNHPKPLVIGDAVKDKNGNLWMVDYDEGIIFYNNSNHSFSKPFTKVLGETNSMSQILYYHDRCYSFNGTSIYQWNPDGQPLQITRLPAQYDKPITSIAIDSTGNLWLATKKGLLVYNFKNKIFDHFTTADGLITNDIDATLLCTKKGIMIIGSPDYLSSFAPARMIASIDHTPHIVLTEVMANGKLIAFDPSKEMSFNHTINNFNFKWTVTDYTNPVNNHYYYKLKGIDEEWHPSGKRGEVEFANLSPGKYTLLLKGENSNGVSADKIISLDFKILQPFWLTWWFLILLFLAIAAIFYSLYRYRLRQALNIERLRNKISLDLHDDIGSTLSSISILSEMALQGKKESVSEEMLYEIKENSLSLLERMDDIVWSINPKNDSLESLFLRIKEFASKLFEAREINYTIQVDEGISNLQLQMEYRQHIYLIMKEAINNLVKYSESKDARISVMHAGHYLEIKIDDNGKGFDAQKVTLGNGLQNMELRAKEMGAVLKINSENDEGTHIFLSVKIK